MSPYEAGKIGGVAVVVLMVFAALLIAAISLTRFITSLVAGVTPTFGRTFLAGLVGGIVSALVSTQQPPIGSSHPLFWFVVVGALVVQVMVQGFLYSLILADSDGRGVSFGQACIVIIGQQVAAFGIGVVLAIIVILSGLYDSSKLPRPPTFVRRASTPVPVIQPGRARLASSIRVTTSYGSMIIPAGTEVKILNETPRGIHIRVGAAETLVSREQLIPF